MSARYADTVTPPASRPAPAAAQAAWRSLLDERWQQRLSTLTELALAYHDADETRRKRPAGAVDAAGAADATGAADAETTDLRRLLREATAARRALSDTEASIARLAAGSFGRCERCAGPIPTSELLAEPETRYCSECVAVSWVTLAG
jgi:DnaK suppressor protein